MSNQILLFYCMSSVQNKPPPAHKLFKMFTIHQDNPPSSTPLSQSKFISMPSTPKTLKTPYTPKASQKTQSDLSSPQNQQVESKLADFKKYLHKSSLMNKQPIIGEPRGRSKSNAERQAMKDRLQIKIKQAHEKLQEIKSTLKKYQQQKSQIINKSEKRRTSITARNPLNHPIHT